MLAKKEVIVQSHHGLGISAVTVDTWHVSKQACPERVSIS